MQARRRKLYMTQQSQGVSYEIGKKERDGRNFSGDEKI